MVSVWPNTTAQTISEWYMVVGHSLIERVTIFLYLTVQEHNWVLHVIHFKSTQIRPDFYIYTHERSFCLIVSIIINIRYISRYIITLWSHFSVYANLRWTHWVLYDIYIRTTQIHPGFYIYTHKRSLCAFARLYLHVWTHQESPTNCALNRRAGQTSPLAFPAQYSWAAMATRVTSCLRVTQKAVLTSLFGANCTYTTNVTNA